jgi:replicative DNA helicase
MLRDLDLETELLEAKASADGWERPIPFHDGATLPTFPAAALPAWWRDYVEATALATQTPVDMPAVLSLAALATCVHGRLMVEVRPGYQEPLNLYVVCVMDPANRKSAVLRAIAAPIERFQSEEAERLRPELAAAAAQRSIDEKRLRQAEEEASKAGPAERKGAEEEAKQLAADLAKQTVAGTPRLLADDATPEQLATLMAANGGRMAVLSAEGAIFEQMCGRYDKNGKENLGIFLKGHAGDTVTIDRRQVQEHIDRPALTLGLAVQPEVIRGLMSNNVLRGRGLLARVLFSLPTSFVGMRRVDAPPVPPSVAESYDASLRSLLVTSMPTEGVLRLSAEALQSFDGYAKGIERHLGPDGELHAIADWAGKLSGAVARIAGILHAANSLAGEPWRLAISKTTLEAAIEIADYFLAHAIAAFAEMGADPAVEGAKAVLRWLLKHGHALVSKRDVFNAHRGRFRRVAALDPVLSLLCQHLFLRPCLAEQQPTRGRPSSPVYEVNPYLFAAAHKPHKPHNGASAHSADSALTERQ